MLKIEHKTSGIYFLFNFKAGENIHFIGGSDLPGLKTWSIVTLPMFEPYSKGWQVNNWYGTNLKFFLVQYYLFQVR